MRVALIGNPNCGKTTLFNALTGMKLRVGNYPGVTVSPSHGVCRFDRTLELVDLPGVYSLDSPGNEEKCARDFIDGRFGDFDAVLLIIDATLIKRALGLFSELCGRKLKLAAALTMNDAAESDGLTVDSEKLSRLLGVPVVKFFPESTAAQLALCEAVHRAANPSPQPPRVLRRALSKVGRDRLTERLDLLFCGSFTGGIFASAALALTFLLIFTLGGRLSAAADSGFARSGAVLSEMLARVGVSEFVRALLIEGALGGVFAVLSFLPGLAILYIMTSVLEDSGYMARIALVSDRSMRRLGLSGKAAVALLLGFGCSVPAIMATETLDSERERGLCISLIPFMTCNAKLPVYLTLAYPVFGKYAALVCFALCLVGVGAAIVGAWVYAACSRLIAKRPAKARRASGNGSSAPEELTSGAKTLKIRRELPPLLLELPKYRLPRPRSVLLTTARRCLDYIKRAGSIVFAASLLFWLLLNLKVNGKSPAEELAGLLGGIFAPLGFGSGELVLALISGLCAKETLAATLKVSSLPFGGIAPMLDSLGIGSAGVCAYLLFILLYPPCIAAEAAIAEKRGAFRALGDFLLRLLLAFAVSFAFFSLCRLGARIIR